MTHLFPPRDDPLALPPGDDAPAVPPSPRDDPPAVPPSPGRRPTGLPLPRRPTFDDELATPAGDCCRYLGCGLWVVIFKQWVASIWVVGVSKKISEKKQIND
ncbi:hypothetical protein FF1_014561 [Malus domestica]